MDPLDENITEKYAANPVAELHGVDGKQINLPFNTFILIITTRITGPIKKTFPTIWSELNHKIFSAAENLGILKNPETVNPF